MPSPHTPGSRDRALARLRRLTVGSILGSVVALGAFATAAALSYSGKATANTPSTGATAPPTSAPATSAPTTPVPQTPRSTPTPTPPPTPAPAPFFGRGHASTGGS